MGIEVAMMLAFGGWKVEQLDWRYVLPLNQPYLKFWYISFKKINSLAQLILRWRSWIAHVVTLFLTKAIGLHLPTIYRLMCSSGRGNVGSPMLCILLSQKLVLVKVVTLYILIIWKWIIEDGEGNGHNTNMMGCGEQTIYCAFQRICPWVVPLIFFMDPP